MCDVVCSDFLDLVNSYEARLNSNDAKHSVLYKSEIETAYGYIHAWPQRQCMCLYRDAKNFERFNYVVQSMIFLCVHHMKHMGRLIADYKRLTASAAQAVAQAQANAAGTVASDSDGKKSTTTDRMSPPPPSSSSPLTTTQETEKTNDADENTEGIHKINESETKSLSKETDNTTTTQADKIDKIAGSPAHSPCHSPPSTSSSVQHSTTPSSTQHTEEPWILPEVEKLILLVSKVFLINFPLYIAYKHGTHARLDDISAEEAQHLAIYCDLHDNEIPVFLLRNISLFCNSGGFAAMMMCFEEPDLPVSIAHAITAAVSNIKLWLNYSCIVQLFVPLRSRVLQYMCKLSDQNLRAAQTRAMADFVWSAIRDPLDASVSFDIEGLALAFKYFTSTTLTMRLAGMAQINAHINLFNEICTTETVGEVEIVGQKIANWLTENQIIQHLFGPNLHVEVIKQAHVVLNFLAVENQITDEHIKLIWQATQLKHCSKTIFDILPSLVKNLAARPAMHLYSLLCHMDPKDHTEQSIYIASALTKSIWTRDSSRSHLNLMQDHLMANTASSSDSGSLDGSNSDDDHGNGDDSSIGSGGRKSPIDIEAINSPPCKQARRRHIICDPTDEKAKLSAAELRLLGSKVDMKMHNHHRIVNIIDNSTSDEDDDDDELHSTGHGLQMHHRKKLRKRSKNAVPLKRLAHNIVEAIWDGSGAAGVGDDDDEASSDEADDVDGDLLNDSDECSDDEGQDVPKAVLKHLQGEGPYIRAIAETHISELLSGAENEGSYSSPMSNKSEKNLADFDDEDISPCEEELAQLVSTHAARVPHGCHMPPAFAAAAAAMAAAQSAMAKQKTEANFAAAAAAVAVAAVATGNAQQSLEAMRQQASAVSASAAGSPALLKREGVVHLKSGDSDIDIRDLSKESPKGSSFGGANSSTSSAGGSGPTMLQPTFKINDVCQPGNTLLWDLLQDDKIHLLGESLALETEKALATLLCFSMDRLLRMKFIEGCLQNLAANRSVIVSLRLLPKLFASFQQFRPSDTHQVTMWAERQHRMMHHFFNNIKFYAKRHAEMSTNKCATTHSAGSSGDNADTGRVPIIYSHKTQVSVRLHFLSSIYSSHGSPKNFRLSLEQVDALWEWLAHDPECADCYFSWLQSQAKGDDQHGLGIETLQHLYLKKLPELRPEEFSMVALGLFQQLCTLARMAIAQYEKHTDCISTSSTNIVGMIHLWKIALRAHNTEVSLAAIQYINMFYMGQQLRLEKEFVTQCMDNLMQAANALEESADDESSMKQAVSALESIQRGLMLLNTHLETFRRRYAFHLRRWAIEGKDIGSHINLKGEGAGPAIRIVLQPAGISEKSILHMHACDLIADLKAEISKWWENLQGISNAGTQAPVLGLLLSEGPLRIITQGQELTSDYDERSLGDAGFKDNQIVYVSLGGRSGARRKELNLDHPSMQPPPPKECLPTVLLLQPRYFEQLFRLMQTLGGMRPNPSNLQLHTKAQLLSRRVWDILAILPTNSQILDLFKGLKDDLSDLDALKEAKKESNDAAVVENKVGQIEQKLQDLLDPGNLQKFMYALHIVESLVLSGVYQNKAGSSACCNVALNGNVMPLEQHTKSLKRAGSKRRNSNSTESVSSMKPASTASGPDSHKESTDSSSPLKDLKTISPSSTASTKSPVTATTQSTTMESEPSEAGSSTNGNDKENSPVKMPMKRQKRSNSSDTEKETPTLQKEPLSNANATAPAAIPIAPPGPKWTEIYIKCGGLKHLYKIFISGQLQQSANPKDPLNEWRHDCLALLLRILCLIGFEEMQADEMHVVISRPHTFMLELMEVDSCLRRLSSILNDEAYQNYASFAATAPFQYHQYCHLRTGFWGRAQVVQFAMNIMVSFVHASSEARSMLWTKPEYCNWVLKFILEDPEPAVRREICAGLYRICLGNAQSYQVLLVPLLRKLISFLPVAEKMTSYPQHTTQQYLFSDEGKEPYGPACRDYFWLLARLVDTLTPEMLKASFAEPCADQPNGIDIERLCESVSQSILSREFHETRHGYQDDGLVGLINLMSNLVKYDPTFKFSPNAVQFIDKIFDFLFDMPSPKNRQKPKCKSATSRAAAYDLLVEMCKNCPKNYSFLHTKLLTQHTPGPKQPYPWDYWPRDEGRSECGYVGLTNLGATCYMASCIQHLYMMPQARAAILNVPPTGAQKHETTLLELQRMFAYLLESERKAYNPRSFCRVYQMDHQPLNTGEQKDMAEFFIDLVSKLEEMTPELKDLVKRLFCGTLSNNVVSLDCGHVSRTAEEFYTVRCQVADMRNLQESLDEVTVKDTLEGDNMYTCSQCGKKVRAEKRACFKKLPQILCFNTMRYTFNMITMLKEKVNTHFSFPMRLNMSDYVEKTLMPHQYQEDREKRKIERAKLTTESSGDAMKNDGDTNLTTDSIEEDIEECLEYELVGVTVHTGTADGGHYYSFIKERNMPPMQHERWFLFNDAEVKPFDPSQIAAECFGGEMTSKTYDSVTEKYLDFSFEKTNSAYMLFYERCLPKHLQQRQSELLTIPAVVSPNKKKTDDENLESTTEKPSVSNKLKNNEDPQTSASAISSSLSSRNSTEIIRFIPQLNKELEDWIWQDNRQFLQDRNIFEHTYFNFMWQICGHIPQTLIAQMDVTCMAAKLSVSFFIETFIHAKEKPTMVPWVELLTKQFNANQEACEWFLMHMSVEPWWPVQVLIQCPNQMVRQMFQRLVIHVIQRLRSTHSNLYLKIEYDDNDKELVGNASCVTRFIRSLVLLMEHGAKAHLRHLSEYFSLLFEFSRMGEEETLFLLRIGVIKSVADFYLGHKTQDCIDVGSDNEDSSDEALSVDKTRPASLDKMIALVANLVERSRGPDLRLRLSLKDFNAIAGGKGFPFLYQQIRDNINPHQTKHLIHALCRWDDRLANQIITMLFASVAKHTELCSPFFKLLTLLTESQGGPSGLPCFSQLILQRVWDAAECCPQSALEWLAFQAPKNKIAHSWILQSADSWVETFLMAHHNARVRNAAAYLLVSLVPSQPFRSNFRSHSLHKLTTMPNNVYRELNEDAQIVLHNIINLLLRLLRPARTYADIGLHSTSKLTSYFSLLSYCMISKTEKLMIGPYMRALWELFHPRLSEPSVPTHHNKHALLAFWHHSIIDCPENALAVANCPEITRNIAFNYILADHDDAEVVNYNRGMLPAYYGLLRLCCEQSRALTRQLAAHQNLQWAFKNITPHPTQYAAAVDELFRLMTLFATRHADANEQEKHEVTTFRRTTLSAYLTSLDARVSWSTLISALKILVDNDEDRLLVIYNGGIEMCFDALHTLHSMHHEATACHVAGDLQELLNELVLLLTTLRISTRLDSHVTNAIVTKQQIEQQAHQLQLLHKQHQQQQQQSQTQSPQQTTQQQQQKEKKLQQQMQQQQLHLQQLQQQHFLRQQQQQHQTGIVKALPDAVKRLATLLNTYNSPEICRLSLEVLKELVRNPNLDVTGILAPILINCHLTVASAPNAIGPLGPYFPRRGVRTPWTTISKSSPRPPRPMVQMCIPHGELLTKGIDADYDAQVDAFYRPYHDFIDVLMRMAVNTNTLNDSLVRLSCLVAIEGAPLHFNLFPKFWVGIYNNKSTHKFAELLIDSQCLVEYVHTVLREARISLRDQFIRTFLEIYYPKIANLLPIARLLYTISYSMHNKEDLDDLCGDLFAIRVIAQCSGIPATVRKQLRGSLKALLYKSSRYKETADNELFAKKKLKLERKAAEELNEKAAATTAAPKETSEDQVEKTASEKPTESEEVSSSPTTSTLVAPHTADEESGKIIVAKNEEAVETEVDKVKEKDAKAETNQVDKTPEDDDEEILPSTSQSLEQKTKLPTAATQILDSNNENNASKCAIKKTADERLLEEYEKHMKVLLNVESYIKTILSLMQKDETGASTSAGSNCGGGVGAAAANTNNDNDSANNATTIEDNETEADNQNKTNTPPTNTTDLSSNKLCDDITSTTIRVVTLNPDTSDSTTTLEECSFRQVDLSAALGESAVSSTNNNNETKIEEILKIGAKNFNFTDEENVSATTATAAEVSKTANKVIQNAENSIVSESSDNVVTPQI